MSDQKTSPLPKSFKQLLQAVGLRLRLQEGLRLTLLTLNAGLLLTLLLTLSGRFYPLVYPCVLLAAGLGVTMSALALVTLYAALRPYSPPALARLVDGRLHLDERLSTALELAGDSHGVPSGLIQIQRADTLRRLQAFDPARAFPLRLNWRWPALAGVLLAALAVSLLAPNPQLEILNRQAQTEAVIDAQKARFEQIRADLAADKTLLDTPQGQELQQTLDKLIATLAKENLSREEALAAIAETEQQLTQLQTAADRQQTTLNDLAQTFNQFDSTQTLAEALQQGDFKQAAESLASAGQNLAADTKTAQDLAQALRQAAQTAQQNGNTNLAQTLTQAAEAVEQAGQSGNAEAAQQALQQAAEALAQAGQQTAGQTGLERALANIQKARQQLAEAGAGQPGAGQGQQTGLGQGTGLAAGKTPVAGGAGREDPGSGADGLTAEKGAPDQMSTDNGPNQGRTGEYESLYAPGHLGGEGGPVVKPPEQGAEGGVPLGDAPVDPQRDPGAALVPYNQVYSQYTDAAGQALDDSYIPLGMKGYIRHYFGALEPEK